MYRKFTTCFALTLVLLAPLNCIADPAAVARQCRVQNEQAIVDGFVQLLSIPNVASDTVNIGRNAIT